MRKLHRYMCKATPKYSRACSTEHDPCVAGIAALRVGTCCLLDLSSDLGPCSAVLKVDPLQAGSSPDDVNMHINQALQAPSGRD